MSMFHEIELHTRSRTQLTDITALINDLVSKSGVREGLCLIFVPHTTAGITINENADSDVADDLVKELNKVIPYEDGYKHQEGNSAAHVKASLMGCSQHVIIKDGRLLLGVWQGIYFTEFDGPRQRKVYIKIIEG